ncbi:Rrf2 family transcriptional regulator [Herbaspirillum sp. NPDC087042]|uniref:Rrf2 family transcriptional regulator n=1 Tax=Herbaspirillum sp. NPDC087042 TaxID=3364004 RepID=UPI0037F9ADE6
MKLTSFTDYSLRVLIYLAAQPERRATIAEIARIFDISESHLMKVVHFLAQQGWLMTVRGKGGGMSLGMPPVEIGIGQVVRATEGPAVPAECFGTQADTCVITDACRLKAVLRKAAEAFYAVLDEYTLADLVRNRTVLAQILQLRPERAA